MKYLKILSGLLIAYTLNSCGILPDALPDETQSGKNTFGCLINGKVFSTDDMTGDFYKTGFNIDTFKDDGSGIGIGIDTLKVGGLGTYRIIKKNMFNYSDGKCGRGAVTPPINATITITKFEWGEDKPNNLRWLIVSGRFEGILPPDTECKDTVKITQGRFDMKLQ